MPKTKNSTHGTDTITLETQNATWDDDYTQCTTADNTAPLSDSSQLLVAEILDGIQASLRFWSSLDRVLEKVEAWAAGTNDTPLRPDATRALNDLAQRLGEKEYARDLVLAQIHKR